MSTTTTTAAVFEPCGSEASSFGTGPALEHRGPLRQLRRLGNRRPHQLGREVRARWCGAIISSNAPVHERGHIVPGYAYLDSDEKIPFWRELGRRVHEHDCRYLVQLVHAGRERILPGLRHAVAEGATDAPEPINGFPCRALRDEQIDEVVDQFAQAARRAREAGLDGVELAGANGMLFTQFLSPAINTRSDGYGGSLENRARFALEVVRAVRAEVGSDFCLGFKISVEEASRELLPWLRRGNSVEDVVTVCGWLEEAGADFLHVSAGTGFPHPRNPAGRFPARDVVSTYDTLLSSGSRTLRNYLVFKTWPLSALFRWWWERPSRRLGVEGINLAASRAVKQAVSIPVLCTGGFQTASVILAAIERGDCDGVTIGRPLVANPDLVRLFEQGHDRPPRPCTYCNRCLFNFVEIHSAVTKRRASTRARRWCGRSSRCTRHSRPSGSRRELRRHVRDLRAAPLSHARAQEPGAAVEPRRPLLELRRDRDAGARQLGPQVRPRRGGGDLSSNAPVHPRGLIVPNYAHIDRDETCPSGARSSGASTSTTAATSSSSPSPGGSATSAGSSSKRGGARPTSRSRSTGCAASG